MIFIKFPAKPCTTHPTSYHISSKIPNFPEHVFDFPSFPPSDFVGKERGQVGEKVDEPKRRAFSVNSVLNVDLDRRIQS
jgi:hypothetical protein